MLQGSSRSFFGRLTLLPAAAFALGLLWTPTALACNFCMLGQGVKPYLTAAGSGVTLDSDYTESDRVYDGGTQIANANKKEAWLTYSLTGFYPVSEDFTVLATLPYSSKANFDYDKDSGTTPGVLVDGFGDATLTGRYTLVSQHSPTNTFKFGSLAALKLPTGKTTALEASGKPVDRHALPGTGSVDYMLGLNSSYSFAGRYQVTADLVYDVAGTGSWGGDQHRYGNSLNFALAGYFKLGAPAALETAYFLYTGVSVESVGKERGVRSDSGYDASLTNDSSGGTVGFWDLGLYGTMETATIVNLSYSRAVYRHMNYSADFDADPAESYKIKIGITRLFIDKGTGTVARR